VPYRSFDLLGETALAAFGEKVLHLEGEEP